MSAVRFTAGVHCRVGLEVAVEALGRRRPVRLPAGTIARCDDVVLRLGTNGRGKYARLVVHPPDDSQPEPLVVFVRVSTRNQIGPGAFLPIVSVLELMALAAQSRLPRAVGEVT